MSVNTNLLIDHLRDGLRQPLPGEAAQLLMAPLGRKGGVSPDQRSLARESAVLILLFPENDVLQLVLIRRPVYDGVHSGQMALPGGRREETDADLSATALRETLEEIGVKVDHSSILGRLTELYIPVSNFAVTPFVACIAERPVFILDQREVAGIVTVPLQELLESRETRSIQLAGGLKIKTPCFTTGSDIVWGATAMILSELAEIRRRTTS